MNIGIIGSGVVGQTLGTRCIEVGHRVTLGTRDPRKLDEKKKFAASLGEWLASAGAGAAVGTFADAARFGEIVVNATHGVASLSALGMAGEDNLRGKILADVSNPLDFSKGMPPTLTVKDTDSLAEMIQRAFPETKVVKTFNTMNCFVMAHPEIVGGGDHTVFVSGNDENAKAAVTGFLRGFGWNDVFDLGDLSSARGAEMILPLWLRIYMRLGNVPFNFKVVR